MNPEEPKRVVFRTSYTPLAWSLTDNTLPQAMARRMCCMLEIACDTSWSESARLGILEAWIGATMHELNRMVMDEQAERRPR